VPICKSANCGSLKKQEEEERFFFLKKGRK
jgi:hypothetical protein